MSRAVEIFLSTSSTLQFSNSATYVGGSLLLLPENPAALSSTCALIFSVPSSSLELSNLPHVERRAEHCIESC